MNTTIRDRQKSVDHHRNYCVHYAPREGNGCKAGMDIETIRCVPTPSSNGSKMVKWGPCIGGHTLADPCSHCPKWERRSLEDAEHYADDIEAALHRMTVVMPVISAWRNQEPRGKSGVIECPSCKGRLHLSQAACNGHVWAKCETEGCVGFIE
jgi:hypothetical protein